MRTMKLAVALLLAAGPALAQSPGTLNLVGPSTNSSAPQITSVTQINGPINTALMAKADASGGVLTNPTLAGTVLLGAGANVNALMVPFTTTAPGAVPAPGSVLGYCLHDNGGWAACTGSSSGGITGPGTTVAGYAATWGGITGATLAAGFPIGLTGNNTIIETGGTGLLAASVMPAINLAASGAGGVTGLLPISTGLSGASTSVLAAMAAPANGSGAISLTTGAAVSGGTIDGETLGATTPVTIIGARNGVTTIAANAYTTLPTDNVVCIDQSAAATVTLLASPAAGTFQTIDDCAGNAPLYAITVQPASGTISGYTNVVMTQANMAISFQYTGITNGWVIR